MGKVIIALSIAVTSILLPLWIWAVFGMSQDIGTASVVTTMVICSIAITFIIAELS